MADETLNVSIVTNAGASAEELANYEALLKQLTEDYAKGAQGAQEFAGAQAQQANQAAQNASTYTQSVEETTNSLDGLKDTVTDVEIHVNGLRRTASALNQLGLGELGTVVQKAAAIQQVFRQVSSIATQVLPDMGAAFSDLAPIIGTTTAEVLALVIPVTIIAAPLIALGLAFKIVSDNLDANRKAAQDNVDAIDADTNARIQNAIAARGLSAEQLNELKIQNDIAIQLKKKEIDELEAQRDQINAEYAASSNPFARAQIADRGLIVQNAITKAFGDLTELGKTGANLYSQATEDQVAANTEAAKSKKDEATATKEAAKASKEYTKDVVSSAKDLIKVTTDLKTENDKYAATLADRVQADARAGATEALQAQIDADKVAEAAQEGTNKLVAIRKSETDLETEEAQKRADGIQKINDQFLQNSVKLWNSYYTTEIRDEADYATQRRRKLEDLNSQLLDLAGSRDVAGFVNARRTGLTSISRGDEDETTNEQRRREDYERQAQEAEKAREDQITQLENSLNQETQTKRAALQQQEAEQIASNNVKLKQSEIDAKKLSDLQAMWSKNDLTAKRLTEDNAHAQTVARLQQQQQELSNIVGNAISPVVSFFGQVTNAIVNMFQQVQAAAYVNTAHTPTGGYASGVNFVPRDMITKVHYGEKITRAVDNHPQKQQNERPINVSIGTWGQVVSEADMHAQVKELVTAIRIANGAPA